MKLSLSEVEERQRDHVSIPLDSEDAIVEAFHRLSYDRARRGESWHAARFRGVPVWKWPGDLWNYRMLFDQVRPRTVIETGTANGGSALYFAAMLDELGGRDSYVITIDIRKLDLAWPAHPRILYVPSFSSVDWPPKRGVYRDGAQITVPPHLEPPVLVVLDSDHSEAHVRRELDIFGRLVTPGSYLVVEDSNVNGHPCLHEHGPGPFEAVAGWLPEHPEFKEDLAIPRRFLFSYHTWLRRVV